MLVHSEWLVGSYNNPDKPLDNLKFFPPLFFHVSHGSLATALHLQAWNKFVEWSRKRASWR
jgi:hypothetical protein